MSETRPFPRTVWWFILVFIALAAVAVFWAVDRFERDLTAEASAALVAAGLEVSVEFDGRDAELSGTLVSALDVDRAVQIVKEVTGVRVVTADAVQVVPLSVPSTTSTTVAPELFPAVVEIAVNEEGVTLAGLVPAASQVALVSAAELVYGAVGVVDNLQTEESVASPEWLLLLPQVFVELGAVDSANIVVGDQGLEIAGTVVRQEAVEVVGIRLAQITRLQVTNQLSFTALPFPSVSALASAGSLTLEGQLPTQGDVDAIVAAADPWFETIDNRLVVGDVADAEWVSSLPGLVEALGSWPSWNVSIDSSMAAVGGFAPSTDELDRLNDEVLAAFGLEWDLGALEVDPVALAGELTSATAGRINFASGSAVLSSESTEILDGVVEALIRNSSARLQVRGHTDDVGPASANQVLSEERAQAVVNYLVSGGIDPDRLGAIGLGEDEPIATNTTSTGRAQNRRIEFVVRSEGVDA